MLSRPVPCLTLALALLGGCSGGGGSGESAGPDGAPTTTSVSAATTTARTHLACVGDGGALNDGITPFYWQIGDRTGALAGASVTGATGTPVGADTRVAIASASKWLYSSYFVQRQGGVAALSAEDIRYFNFRSGYTNFAGCSETSTVASCLAEPNPNGGSNGDFVRDDLGKFAYGGGHMQQHAALNGLGNLGNEDLATEMQRQLGSDVALSYGSPQLAGGARASANAYARVLRKIVAGDLLMRDALGTHAVCTNPDQTGCPAVNTPSPPGEFWHYSVGHWVEDDPAVGDGAFSSPGAFGFYPWIDSSRRWYGVVVPGPSLQPLLAKSIDCGRAIRRAWLTGIVQ